MAKYGITIYRTDVYGPDPGLDFSVSPIELTVLDFNCVKVVWRQSAGSYSMARLLRSQNSFPETVDDGEVVWSQASTDGSAISLSRNTLLDGRENAATNVSLVPGKSVFYRMFLFDTASKQWLKAGDAYTLIPANHQLHRTLMNWIPRVYSSADQNPIGIIDETSDLYRFLDGFAFTGEELMTYIDILQPTKSQDRYTHVPRVQLERESLGLLPEPTLPIKNQRTLIREARYLYSRKGTQLGVESYVEALTGFAPTITTDANLLLSNQDATFHLTSGNWVASAGTLSSVKDSSSISANVSAEARSIDNKYFGRLVTETSGVTMSLGYNSTPLTTKVPLTPGKKYTLSFYYKSASDKTVTPRVDVYDQHGTSVANFTGSSVSSASWSKVTLSNIVAPKAFRQAISFVDSDGTTITYSTYEAPQMLVGSVVNISGFSNSAFNITGAVVASVSSDSFTVATAVTAAFEAPTSAIVVSTHAGNDGLYAGIQLTLGDAATYEFDMFCLQEGTSSTYSEARAVDIVLNPYKINYIKNPSFEPAIVDGVVPEWTVDGVDVARNSSVPSTISAGSYSAYLDASEEWTLNSNTVPVIKGQYWTASMYYKSDEPITLALVKRNSAGTVMENNFTEFEASATWKRVSVTSVVDCACVSATLEVQISGNLGEFWIDGVQLEKSFKVTEYYDGSYSFDTGAEWQGADHASYTIVYPNKPLKIWRLVNTIEDWIPKHLFWRISTLGGVESKTTIE